MILDKKEIDSEPVEEEVVTVKSSVSTTKEETSSRSRNSLFSRRFKRPQLPIRSKTVDENIETSIPTTAASVIVTRPSLLTSKNEVQTEPEGEPKLHKVKEVSVTKA